MRLPRLSNGDEPTLVNSKWWVLAVVGASTFMSAIDTSIVNIALPAIAAQTNATTASLQWVVLSYLLSVTSTLLLFGRIADLFGRRTIYLLGQATFGLASLGCALSPSVLGLISCRAFQGLGAAMLFAVGPALLTSTFKPAERGKALGLQATMTYLGLSTGPALGGILTQHLGWSAIFFVNVPVSVGALLLARCVLSRDSERKPQRLDWPGAATLGLALSALLIALTKSHAEPWASPLVNGLLVLALGLSVLFVWVERRSKHPALNLQLFANPTFAASTFASLCCYAATASINFLLPFLLLLGLGITPSHAGLLLTITPLTMMVFTAPSGMLSDRVGVRLPTVLGMALMGCGAILLHFVESRGTIAILVLAALSVGVGAGLFTAPNNSAIMGSAPSEQRGVASAILAAARTTGFAIGTAIAGLLYASVVGHQVRSVHVSAELVTAATHRGAWAVLVFAVIACALSVVRREARSR
jgi:EmrB/QacA subfamily drug resistance transporter